MVFTAGVRQDRWTSLPTSFGAKESRSERGGVLQVGLLGCSIKAEPFCPLFGGRDHWHPLASHPQSSIQRVSEGGRKHSFILRREMELEGLDIPAEPMLLSSAFPDFPRWVWDRADAWRPALQWW